MSKLTLYLFENPSFLGFSGLYKLIVELGLHNIGLLIFSEFEKHKYLHSNG
ncbi:hypothetical protein CSC2_26030 [Clostridium zeae]|uniref:Uncharacterized protein n=1 Tax=Clostridium zeae TaxID=2759022 RepID=A0ABQ1EBA9_9CLOT|nr:hypothetical protein CSC2_26030 [Clostridium zeae]